MLILIVYFYCTINYNRLMGNISVRRFVKIGLDQNLKCHYFEDKDKRRRYVYISLYNTSFKAVSKYGIANGATVISELEYHKEIHSNITDLYNLFIYSTYNTDKLYPYIQMLEYITHIASVYYDLVNNYNTICYSDVSLINQEYNPFKDIFLNQLGNPEDHRVIIKFNNINDLREKFKYIINKHEEHITYKEDDKGNKEAITNKRYHDKKRRILTSLLLHICNKTAHKFNLEYELVQYRLKDKAEIDYGNIIVTSGLTVQLTPTSNIITEINDIKTPYLNVLLHKTFEDKCNGIFNMILDKLEDVKNIPYNVDQLYGYIVNSLLDLSENMSLPEELYYNIFEHKDTGIYC